MLARSNALSSQWPKGLPRPIAYNCMHVCACQHAACRLCTEMPSLTQCTTPSSPQQAFGQDDMIRLDTTFNVIMRVGDQLDGETLGLVVDMKGKPILVSHRLLD